MTKKAKHFPIFQMGFIILLLLIWNNNAAALSPKEILQQCDQARGNISGVVWDIKVEDRGKNKISHRHLQVQSQNYNAIAETLSPARLRGQMLILLNGNMWFYKPGLSKPIPVSKRQKLLGLANNGDIASTNYAEDYTIVRQELDQLDHEPCDVFTLEAITRNATYKSIKYWVSKKRVVGIKAQFYTARGTKLLKSARMEYKNNFVSKEGKSQPFISRMVIHDELMPANKTILSFSRPLIKPLPAAVFNLNLLKR